MGIFIFLYNNHNNWGINSASVFNKGGLNKIYNVYLVKYEIGAMCLKLKNIMLNKTITT